jgi:DNA-binding TFAR19-related protein (PDSD5 family)
MRSRTNTDPSQAAIARLQQQSGCRVHIERSVEQVRLFGPKRKQQVVQRLLEDLDRMCISEVVRMPFAPQLDTQMLQTFAQEFGVTLQVDGEQLAVIGIQGAVSEATEELRKCESGRQHFEQGVCAGKISDAARSAITAAMNSLIGDEDVEPLPIASGCATPEMENESSMMALENLMQGAVISKLPTPPPKEPPPDKAHKTSKNQIQGKFQAKDKQAFNGTYCPTCGSEGRFCINCGKPTRDGPAEGCRTCGTVRFCVYCGHPTEKNQMESFQKMQLYMGAASMGEAASPMLNQNKTDIYCAEQVQTMPMQFVQSNAMQIGSPQPYTQEGMMTMCIPVGAVGVPFQPQRSSMPYQPGAPSGGMAVVQAAPAPNGGWQVASNMMSGAANGIQACMVPWAFGQFE